MTVQNFDTFSATISGLKYSPYSLALQVASVGLVVTLTEWTNWDVIKDVYLPKSCQGLDTLGLVQTLALGILWPAVEEMGVRGVFQDGVLTRVPSTVLSIFGKEHWAGSLVAKVIRTIASAAVFSGMHLVNQNALSLSSPQMAFQLANTFGMGLCIAAVQERERSIWPGFGVHAAVNAIAMSIPFGFCLTKSSDSDATPDRSASISSLPSSKTCASRPPFERPTCNAENQALIDQAVQFDEMKQQYQETAKRYQYLAESAVEWASLYATEVEKLRNNAQADISMKEP